jgi:uncharacterized protein
LVRSCSIEITLFLSEDCNLRCGYCYQPRFARTAMSVDTAMTAVDSALAHGAESLALTFFGGEPLLQAPAMFDILRRARALEAVNGVPVTAKVSTNGLLLDADVLAEGTDLGLFFSLSIDGVREAHDAARRTCDGAGSFDAAAQALQLLVDANRPFATYSVVTPDTVRYLAKSVAFLWDAGSRIIINTPDYTATWDEPALAELSRQYARMGKFYRRLLAHKEPFHLEPFDSRVSHRTRATEYRPCQPGIHQVLVAPDGTLYGCIEYFHRRLDPLGTVAEWIDRERLKTVSVARSHAPEACGSCGVSDRCNRACACVNLRGTGRPAEPPATLCLGEQATIRAVDQVAAKIFRKKVPEFLMRHYSCSYHVLSGIEKLIESMEAEHESAQTR